MLLCAGSAGIHGYPNPFNPTATIAYTVSKAGPVSLIVYNVKGELVDVLVKNEFHEPSNYLVEYHAQDGAGVYFVRLVAGDETKSLKLVLLK